MKSRTQRWYCPSIGIRAGRGTVGLLLAAAFLMVLSGCGKKEEPVQKEVVRPVKIITVASAGETGEHKFAGTVRYHWGR